jgi:hypothetical protein
MRLIDDKQVEITTRIDKQVEITTRIEELRTFAAQLDDVRASLQASPPPVTCRTDLNCCVPANDSAFVLVELTHS